MIGYEYINKEKKENESYEKIQFKNTTRITQ